MNLSYNPKKFRVDLDAQVTDQDKAEYNDLFAMLNSKGWQVLKKYQELIVEKILDDGMEGLNSETTRKLSDLKLAVLKGFKECSMLPEKIEDRMRKFLEMEAQIHTEAESNDDSIPTDAGFIGQ